MNLQQIKDMNRRGGAVASGLAPQYKTASSDIAARALQFFPVEALSKQLNQGSNINQSLSQKNVAKSERLSSQNKSFFDAISSNLPPRVSESARLIKAEERNQQNE